MLHAVIHILLGIISLWLGFHGRARGFCKFLGILLLAVGVLRFVPGTREIIIILLNVNPAVAYVNIVVGVLAFFVVSGEGHETGGVGHHMHGRHRTQ